MGKVVFGIIISLLGSCCITLADSPTRDSLLNSVRVSADTIKAATAHSENDINLLQDKIEALQSELNRLETKLEIYAAKECFFESQLSIQTGLFSLIVFGLLTLAGFVGWKELLRSEKKVDERLNFEIEKIKFFKQEMETKFALVQNEIKTVYRNAADQASTMNRMVAEQWKGQENKGMALYHYVSAAINSVEAAGLSKIDKYKQQLVIFAQDDLANCNELVSNDVLTQLHKSNKGAFEELLPFLSLILKSDIEQVKGNAGRLFAMISQFVETTNRNAAPPTT